MRFRVHCPTCQRTLEQSVVAPEKCPWTHTHAVEVTEVKVPLEQSVIWHSLFINLGGDPKLLPRI